MKEDISIKNVEFIYIYLNISAEIAITTNKL